MDTKIDYGQVWFEIRYGLSNEREALKAAFQEAYYDNESSALDAVARTITDRLRERLEKLSAS